MESTYLFHIVIQILKVLLIKICKIQPPDLLFLFVFISFYFSRYHFSQISRTLFKNIWKKYYRHEFPFLTDSLRILHPLNGQNPLCVTKVFCRCSLILICHKSFGRDSLTYPIQSWCAIPLCHSPHFVLP